MKRTLILTAVACPVLLVLAWVAVCEHLIRRRNIRPYRPRYFEGDDQ